MAKRVATGEFDETERRHKIGANIRRLRTSLNWTQRDLGLAVGVKVQRVSDVERGVKDPTLGTLLRFAKALHVTVHQLIS